MTEMKSGHFIVENRKECGRNNVKKNRLLGGLPLMIGCFLPIVAIEALIRRLLDRVSEFLNQITTD